MRILAVGGGSGGHVTPVVAVVNELAILHPDIEVTFVCDRAFEDQSRGLMKTARVFIDVHVITAGKFRRYSHLTTWQQLFSWQIAGKNIVDSVKIAWGFVQSLGLLIWHRPAVVFAKGGYVCLPVGLAARLLRIPVVIHDSDTRPGLTNKVLARFATKIATGFPLDNYPYNPQKSRYVGVPIDTAFQPVTPAEQAANKQALGYDADQSLVVVTGGGLGAYSINQAMVAAAPALMDKGIGVYHVTGKKQHDTIQKELHKQIGDTGMYQAVSFVYNDMEKVLSAADVVVARGSATFLQEMAGIGKAVIVIPAKQLGDQLKNAAMYKKAKAALVLSDDDITDSNRLETEVLSLLDDEQRRLAFAERLHAFARPQAAQDTAELILEAVPKKKLEERPDHEA